MASRPPIGIDDFRTVIEEGYLYVDKTAMIQEVSQNPAVVQLITRPRRFGKTINLSMLRYFFDTRVEGAALFRGLAVENSSCYSDLGRHPVIFLSFKDLKARDYPGFLGRFGAMMGRAFRRCAYLEEGLSDWEQEEFKRISEVKAEENHLLDSLALLMELLARHHQQKVVLLIDEYDSPIHEGYTNNYYDGVVHFMRTCLGQALKGNRVLQKAVMTGILRVARESIFSDLNNVKVFTLLNQTFSDKFGFTPAEVAALLEPGGSSEQRQSVEKWYNGYTAGDTVIYNPWSILNYLAAPEEGFQLHWVNTSSNELIREQLLKATPEVQDHLMRLLQGEWIETQIWEHTVFRDLTADAQTLWSFLLFSGYLKVVEKVLKDESTWYRLAIPNTEVKLLFRDIIAGWLRRHYGSNKVEQLLASLVSGDFQSFEILLADLVRTVLSYYDTDPRKPERVYHAFVLGLLVNLGGRYEIKSNRESGLGRYDLMLRPRNTSDRGIILEFKAAEAPEALEAALEAGLEQIEARHYGAELEAAGVGLRSEIAVAFSGRNVRIRGREIKT